MKSISTKSTYKLLGIFLVFALWEILSLLVGNGSLIFPGPVPVFSYCLKLFANPYLYQCLKASMVRMLTGFGLAFVLGFALGTLSGNREEIHELLEPLMVTLKTIPTASLVFLFLVLFGSRKAPIALVVLISFPVLYEGFYEGVRNLSKDVKMAVRLEDTSFLRRNLYVYLPLALPYVFAAIHSSFSLSFKIEIMAEVITGDTRLGLGCAILAASKNDPSNLVPVFAYSLVAIGLMFVLEWLLARIERFVQFSFGA